MNKENKNKNTIINKDILEIDQHIQKSLSEELNNEKNYRELYISIRNSSSLREKREFNKISKILEDIDSNLYAEYIALVHNIMEDYININKKTVKRTFLYSDNKSYQDLDDKRKKINVLEKKYINILQNNFQRIIERYNINIHEIKLYSEDFHENENCDNCGSNDFNYNNSFSVCKICGLETPTINTDINYHDTDRINTNKKYKYSRIVHFKDTINQFQGKQNKYIDKKVYQDLEREFREHKLIGNGEEVGKYKKITKDHIKIFLNETGHTKHYEDINLLYNYYTGFPLPDISHLEEKLLKDFELILEAYEQIETEKTNFLHGQYILYQLLRRYKYDCREEDFTMLKTIDKKIEHDDYYEKICNILQWKFESSV
jgi:hypothetical protein